MFCVDKYDLIEDKQLKVFQSVWIDGSYIKTPDFVAPPTITDAFSEIFKVYQA
jgi:hypothetical protein